MVKQCTAHSLGFVDGTSASSLGEIKRFTKVKIIKSGKIIPKIVGVVKPLFITQNTGYTIKINGVVQNSGNSIPHNCPSCNSKLQIEENADGKHLICNSEFCGVRAVARLVHFLSTIGVKGISDAIVKRLVEEEFVTYPNEFYGITVGQLKGIGFSPRNAHLIVSILKMHPNPTSHTDEELAKYIDETEKFPIPGDLLFSALGIAGAGKSAGQELINHFGSFEAIRFATVDQLMEVNGIGKPTAENIAKFFVEYETVVEEICEFLEPTKIKQGPLSGQTFVFTGTFPEGKEKWQNEVREKGGTISGSVSKTTNFVVVGADAGSKLEKATANGSLMTASINKHIICKLY